VMGVADESVDEECSSDEEECSFGEEESSSDEDEDEEDVTGLLADVELNDDSDEEEVPVYFDVNEDVLGYHDDDNEKRFRKKKGQIQEEVPLEMQYSMFAEGSEQGLPEPFEFNPRYVGDKKSLNFLSHFTEMELVNYMWRTIAVHIVNCFNKRIHQENLIHVDELTLGELYRWYGLRLYMGIFQRPSEADFFREINFGMKITPLEDVSKYMSQTRFKEIKSTLRFDDYNSVPEEEKKDKAWKERKIFNMMKTKCREGMPSPGKFISVDNAMVKYFGRHCPIAKSMPANPIKRGFMFYCAVDSETKWVFDIDLSDSKYEGVFNESWGKSGQRVLDLLRPLSGEWYVVVLDRYYSSEPLAIELLRRRFYMLGTLRENRLPPGTPTEMASLTKHPKPTKQYPEVTIKSCVKTNNTISLLSLIECEHAYLLDTLHGPTAMDILIHKCKGKVDEHNVYKGFVDYDAKWKRAHSLDSPHRTVVMHERVARWTVRFVDCLFNFALAQAWVAWRHHHPEDSRYDARDKFTMVVCGGLLDNQEDANQTSYNGIDHGN
jgi:hypothetical protein